MAVFLLRNIMKRKRCFPEIRSNLFTILTGIKKKKYFGLTDYDRYENTLKHSAIN